MEQLHAYAIEYVYYFIDYYIEGDGYMFVK